MSVTPGTESPQYPSPPSPYNATIEALLLHKFPHKIFLDLAIGLAGDRMRAHVQEDPTGIYKPIELERERLRALPESELSRLQAVMSKAIAAKAEANAVQRKIQLQAKASAQEAAMFYNQANASADFEHWAKMGYWTFEEAIALLLGKNPDVVTRAAIEGAISSQAGFSLSLKRAPIPAGFLNSYETIRKIAERAAVMRTAQLKPADVLLWAHRSGAIEPPPELVDAVVARVRMLAPAKTQPMEVAKALPNVDTSKAVQTGEHTTLKRSALVKRYGHTWQTIESDLRHSDENGLKKFAKADGHGLWFEERSLQWARQNGKLPDSDSPQAHSPFGRVHRIGS